MKVGIFELSRGYDVWVWLCQQCLNARRKAGWTVKTRKKPPHDLTCDDCERR